MGGWVSGWMGGRVSGRVGGGRASGCGSSEFVPMFVSLRGLSCGVSCLREQHRKHGFQNPCVGPNFFVLTGQLHCGRRAAKQIDTTSQQGHISSLYFVRTLGGSFSCLLVTPNLPTARNSYHETSNKCTFRIRRCRCWGGFGQHGGHFVRMPPCVSRATEAWRN